MRDETHHLLRLRGLLDTAHEIVDRLADDAPPTDEERAVLAAAMRAMNASQPRTRADIVRFVDAIQGGDEAWLVVRSIPGESRVEAVYTTKLSPSVRKNLGM